MPCLTYVLCCMYMAACLQVESAANITSLPNSNPSQQHLSRGEQAASQAASWAPPNTANAAAPSAAMLSSLQQPRMDRSAALLTSQHLPAMHSRPSAPYLNRHTGMQPSRHRPHPVSTAAAAAADKRQLAQERRLNVQHSSRLRQAPDNAAAAEAGDRLPTHQSVALRLESLAASRTRGHAAASGVIDLTADGCFDSPSTSIGSECMILGASAAPRDPMASASTRHTQDWAQAGPSCITEEPVVSSRRAHLIRSPEAAEVGVAEPWQSSNAVMQLPQGDDRVGDLSSGSASRAAAEPWQSSGFVPQVPGEDGRPADVRGVSAGPGGSTLAPPRNPSAQLTLPLAGAQAACLCRKRSRWDIMPESMSADSTPAQQPPPVEAPHDLAVQNRDSNAAQRARGESAAMSAPVLYQAERQPLHSQQPTNPPQQVSVDSGLEQSEAATQQDSQRVCRSPHHAQQSKRSCTGRKHSRHGRSRSSRRSRHSKRRMGSRSSHDNGRSYKHYRRWRSGSPDARFVVDGRDMSGSSSGHARHVLDTPDMLYAQIDSQHQSSPNADERVHAAMRREASQGDRWQMWQPQDV